MAEKKFFVDINLQGSALTNAKIGTNTGIGSTEGAFGYDSSAHRLQYFDGTATKDVANLSDVAAVTGGLIFQGGYDPTTNTPDITDGTALKGFFWAATAVGTFLGESVQVGDSIVAKVDNAGSTLSDWLILQGNVVIATDTVDGISRLATQTEANDGTEAGAVVITPATLQGKIDAQITPEISNKLPLAGGTMSGNINMGSQSILDIGTAYINNLNSPDFTSPINLDINIDAGTENTIINLPAPTNDGDAANKLYVDNASNDKLPLAGGTMSGNINMDGASLNNSGAVYTNNLASSLNTEIILLNDLRSSNGSKITNLPTPTNGGDATNKTYVDNADALKLDLAGGTMSGDIDMSNNGIENINYLLLDSFQAIAVNNAGPLSLFDNKITDLAAPTNGGDAANKTYVDGQVATALPLAGGTMSGNINMGGTASIQGADFVSADRISTNNLDGFGSDITVDNGLDFGGNNLPKNLAAPTNSGDAVNKEYVDTAASTAQANAEATASADATAKADAAQAAAEAYADSLAPNYDAAGSAAQALTDAEAYTDTAIAAQSAHQTIYPEDWTLVSGSNEYYYTFVHNLNADIPLIQVMNSGRQPIEMLTQANTQNEVIVYTNIIPSMEVELSVMKTTW